MKICYVCSGINEDQSTCKHCKNNLSPPEEILTFAKDALEFGYRYRTRYEFQVEKSGKVSVKYNLLEPTTIWESLTLIALSGIVGNVAYAGFLSICRGVKEYLVGNKPKKLKDAQFNELLDVLENDDKIAEFYAYVQAYYHQMPNVDDRVLDAIREEQKVDRLSKLVDKKKLDTMSAYKELRRLEANNLLDKIPDTKSLEIINSIKNT